MLKSFKQKENDTRWKPRCTKKEYRALEIVNVWVHIVFVLLFKFFSNQNITKSHLTKNDRVRKLQGLVPPLKQPSCEKKLSESTISVFQNLNGHLQQPETQLMKEKAPKLQCARTSDHPPSAALLWQWAEKLVGTQASRKDRVFQNVGVMHFGYFSNSLKDQHRCLALFWPPQATATSLTTVIGRFEDTHIFVLLGISGTDT